MKECRRSRIEHSLEWSLILPPHYYISVWQQFVHGASAASSSIASLPFTLGVVLMAYLISFLIIRIRILYVSYDLVNYRVLSGKANVGRCILRSSFTVRAATITLIRDGRMTAWIVNTLSSHCVGYQALTGLGICSGH